MFQNLKIAFFLATRQIKRGSKWTNVLIIFVMALTFLNLVVVSGILVGLIEGSVTAYRESYTGDLLIRNLDKKSYIEKSQDIIGAIEAMPEVLYYSARYMEGGEIESQYKEKTKEDERDIGNATFAGIDPEKENQLSGISKFMVEGDYLLADDFDKIIVGSLLIKKYTPIEAAGFTALEGIYPGAKVRVTIGENVRDVVVKGIIQSKVDDVSFKVYFPEKEFRSLIGRDDNNVDEIAVRLKPGVDPKIVKDALLRTGFGQYAKIQTYEDAQPKFLKDIKDTFALLGNAIGSIGLVVASITIFIVIFINAITRRKYIGIMKGIGINGKAIEISYVFQSLFYAIIGSAIGVFVVYVLLVPLFLAHPINFPFSDGILVAPLDSVLWKVGLLIFATIIAGYIPARMIVRRNTLDAILGR